MATTTTTMSKITIETMICMDRTKVWEYYTNPSHIVHWNFATEDWCCPSAHNELKLGGTYRARMESKDGSMGFDFQAEYTALLPEQSFTYVFVEDARAVSVEFLGENENENDQEEGSPNNNHQKTRVTITFDADTEHSIEMQRSGWQAILNNFKKYAEEQEHSK
jgi:uncharacterized protein YndB with AHSA1/START domain